MTDFSLKAYIKYIEAFISKKYQFVLFKDFILNQNNIEHFCLIRHDVDRKAKNSLKMAEIEAKMDIKSTYYFRATSNSFSKEIVKEISNLGHEIGYHYENLALAKGNMETAYQDFIVNLSRFREVTEIKTISMHGSPLQNFDNRDLWKDPDYYSKLKELEILGEVYLDIDYSDILYISDTGRNWSSDRNNRRDKVESNIKIDFRNGIELLKYLSEKPHRKLVFQIHPERWDDKYFDWNVQLLKDSLINLAKKVIS